MENKVNCDVTGMCSHEQAFTPSGAGRTDTVEIIYGYDPLCGWCYGFSAHLQQIRAAFRDKVRFTLLNGGIFANTRQTPMEFISAHINRSMPYVTERTGAIFGAHFRQLLLKKEYPYDSEKASVAVTVFRELLPGKVFEFAAAVQTAFFYNGMDIHADSTYLELIRPFDIDPPLFLSKLQSAASRQLTHEEYSAAARYRLAYPSSLIISPLGTEMLHEGFEPASQVIAKIERKLLQLQQTSVVTGHT
ncbi:DsbA family protein [Chitinophaga sp. Mgbs1]|uniref:DsbA family protein n=1 Tax=Chitinophaga solisilvae TaxID=1233460 RepID=A0A3S1BIS7_9BACT|nr:DsbA family protein [Chitinophaga solisilvae]